MSCAGVNKKNLIVRISGFYLEGFRKMTVGRTLWKIICLKLIILFGVLKLFFFPDFLNTHFPSDQQRADYVIDQITIRTGMQTDEIGR